MPDVANEAGVSVMTVQRLPQDTESATEEIKKEWTTRATSKRIWRILLIERKLSARFRSSLPAEPDTGLWRIAGELGHVKL